MKKLVINEDADKSKLRIERKSSPLKQLILRCPTCDHTRSIERIDDALLHNWPLCCNRPMRPEEI